MQVYTVLYEQSGRFLLAHKPLRGYYFIDERTGVGSVLRSGKALNGAGNYALPGGKRKQDEPLNVAGWREFQEETGVQIAALATTNHEFSNDYAAVYVRSAQQQFNTTATDIIQIRLPDGMGAAHQIADDKIRSYADIFRNFPQAPPDNELDDGYIWDVNDPTDWQIIESWHNDPNIGWYYEILRYLKTSVLALATA